MQVPKLIVVFCCIAVVALVWWHGTRHLDFLQAPTAQELSAIRAKAAAEFPRKESPPEPVLVKLPPVPILPPEPPPAKAPVSMGDLSVPPQLNQYAERRELGIEHFLELTKMLEENQQPQLALLAWERILDSLAAPATDQEAAVSAIRRLRPEHGEWTSQEENIPTLVIQFGTQKATAKRLRPLLETLEEDLRQAASGLVRFSSQITTGKSQRGNSAAPIAIWVTGEKKSSTSTEVMSFTLDDPEQLRVQVLASVFQLMRSHLARHTSYQAPAALTKDENPLDALQYRITRLAWREIGLGLNLSQKSGESGNDAR